MSKHYEELQALFSLDPLLVFRVAYICPNSDIGDLCDHIHLPYAISFVSMKIENMRKKLSVAGDFEVSVNACKMYMNAYHALVHCLGWWCGVQTIECYTNESEWNWIT